MSLTALWGSDFTSLGGMESGLLPLGLLLAAQRCDYWPRQILSPRTPNPPAVSRAVQSEGQSPFLGRPSQRLRACSLSHPPTPRAADTLAFCRFPDLSSQPQDLGTCWPLGLQCSPPHACAVTASLCSSEGQKVCIRFPGPLYRITTSWRLQRQKCTLTSQRPEIEASPGRAPS